MPCCRRVLNPMLSLTINSECHLSLLSLSSWCLVIVVWLFLVVSWLCLQFVIVVFPDQTHYFCDFLGEGFGPPPPTCGRELVVLQVVILLVCTKEYIMSMRAG